MGSKSNEGAQPPDPFNLQRFAGAQVLSYEQAAAELRQGSKKSHWMWYIFPQLRCLGRSPMAQMYGIGSEDEARAYLAHPVLGPRLSECTQLALDAEATSAGDIFPFPDDLKFRSCMTLFALAAPEPDLFRAALEKFFGGEPDPETLRLLSSLRR